MAKKPKKGPDYQFHAVLPFPSFKGARQMVRSKIVKSLGFWKPEFWLPIPMAKTIEELDKLCKKLYNLSLVQLLGRGVRQLHYDSDIPIKKWYNDQMSDKKDVPNCETPETSFWFIIPKESKVSEIKQYREIQVKTGKTTDELAELLADPKKLREYAKEIEARNKKLDASSIK